MDIRRRQAVLDMLLLFASALLLRLLFFQGCVLGDDLMEIGLIQSAFQHRPADQLYCRFFVWLLNEPTFKLFGLSEWTLFLPTWLLSSSFSVMSYRLLRQFSYTRWKAFFAGLFVACAPFEIMLGTLRANDLFLAWFLACAFIVLLRPTLSPTRKGAWVAVFLWAAFYVKLWAVYFLPVVGAYFAWQAWHGETRSLRSFLGISLGLHGATCVFWRFHTGTYFPFFKMLPGTYPILHGEFLWLFTVYPKMLFNGSDLHTTLFGLVPYLFCAAILVKTTGSFGRKSALSWDPLDGWIVLYAGTFFLLLNFAPNHFRLDHYYSAPRIFRYLAPVSFPLTLFAAKTVLDVIRLVLQGKSAPHRGKQLAAAGGLIALIGFNLIGAESATRPGRQYRSVVRQCVKNIAMLNPPTVIAESWLAGLLLTVYASSFDPKTKIELIANISNPLDYEAWLHYREVTLPNGSVLISGLGSYVHYGCPGCGFLLSEFLNPLNPRWTLAANLGVRPNSGDGEQVCVWTYRRKS